CAVPTRCADSDRGCRHPEYRSVYDKIALALGQGLEAGPYGVRPPYFPSSPSLSPISKAWASAAACRGPPPNTKPISRRPYVGAAARGSPCQLRRRTLRPHCSHRSGKLQEVTSVQVTFHEEKERTRTRSPSITPYRQAASGSQ